MNAADAVVADPAAASDRMATVSYLPTAAPRPAAADAASVVAAATAASVSPSVKEVRRIGDSSEGETAARPKGSDRHPAGSARGLSGANSRAENVSLHALTRRGMSRAELEKVLVDRDVAPEEVDAELDRLERVGLVDDAALAETIVRTQHERKGLGRSALVAELRRRHIDQEHIETALEQVDDDGELARARELAERRAPQLRSLDRVTAVRRLTGYLLRKGYPSSIIRTVVEDAIDGRTRSVRFED